MATGPVLVTRQRPRSRPVAVLGWLTVANQVGRHDEVEAPRGAPDHAGLRQVYTRRLVLHRLENRRAVRVRIQRIVEKGFDDTWRLVAATCGHVSQVPPLIHQLDDVAYDDEPREERQSDQCYRMCRYLGQ